jgi:hypothetical protein
LLLGQLPPAPMPPPMAAPAVVVGRDSRQLGAAIATTGAILLFGPRRAMGLAGIVAGAVVWRLGYQRARQIARSHWQEIAP